MKVGERWKLTNPSAHLRSDTLFGNIITIVKLFKREDSEDWVEFRFTEKEWPDDANCPETDWFGRLRRWDFLENYEKIY